MLFVTADVGDGEEEMDADIGGTSTSSLATTSAAAVVPVSRPATSLATTTAAATVPVIRPATLQFTTWAFAKTTTVLSKSTVRKITTYVTPTTMQVTSETVPRGAGTTAPTAKASSAVRTDGDGKKLRK